MLFPKNSYFDAKLLILFNIAKKKGGNLRKVPPFSCNKPFLYFKACFLYCIILQNNRSCSCEHKLHSDAELPSWLRRRVPVLPLALPS